MFGSSLWFKLFICVTVIQFSNLTTGTAGALNSDLRGQIERSIKPLASDTLLSSYYCFPPLYEHQLSDKTPKISTHISLNLVSHKSKVSLMVLNNAITRKLYRPRQGCPLLQNFVFIMYTLCRKKTRSIWKSVVLYCE